MKAHSSASLPAAARPRARRRAARRSLPKEIGSRPGTALRVSIAAALTFFVSMTGAPKARGGDLLRGGAAAGSPGVTRASAGGPGSAAAAAASVNAKDNLARTTAAVTAMQAMQTAARLQAQRTSGSTGLTYQGRTLPAVPNGLVTGGLQVAPGAATNASLWSGAGQPTQTVSNGHTEVDIKQTSSTALLTWQTFNIGRETSLNFDQTAGGSRRGQWIAYNMIEDPAGSPSQILGSISASGQVYVINRNGIVFGGGAVVNTHAFVASALPIDGGLVQRGILNNPDAQFLFSALAQPKGANGTPAFVPTVSDAAFQVSDGSPTHTLSQTLATGSIPTVIALGQAVGSTALAAGADYTLATAGGKTTLTFTASGLTKTAGSQVTVSYTSASQRYGDVIVERGAVLYSPSSAAHVGGKVVLAGANVVNDGSIITPDGQTILAAGLQVGFSAHASSDPSLRGLDVYVGQVADPLSTLQPYAGTATNSGSITSSRASVTIAGKQVNQLGVIDDSTSVSLNGRIDLLAQYNAVPNAAFVAKSSQVPFVAQASGTVVLGGGSATRILPELASTDTVVGTQLALPSLFNAEGRAIYFGVHSTLFAPSAALPSATTAVDAAAIPLFAGVSLTAQNGPSQAGKGGQVYLDRGAAIDVSGSTDVPAPVSENIVSVQVRGIELANSPLQRAGVVRGQTINIDLRDAGVFNGQYWIGTPLADTLGYVGLVKRGVGELTVAGGTVAVNSSSSVVTQPDSMINVSGGSVSYQGDVIETTRLLSQGQVYTMAQATPDRVYDGIYTGAFTVASPKYGFSATFNSPLALSGSHFEQGYEQGGNGGSVIVDAPSVALDGSLLGQTEAGPRQRTAATQPLPSSFTLNFPTRDAQQGVFSYFTTSSLPAPAVVFDANSKLAPVGAFSVDATGAPALLPAARLNEVALSPDLVGTGGFGSITVNDYDGSITLPEGVVLGFKPLGALTLAGSNIDLRGRISAPGGTLNFTVSDVSSTYLQLAQTSVNPPPPVFDPARGNFFLRAGASLDVSGLLTDDRFEPASRQPLVTSGGQINIAAHSAAFDAGSVLNVSGGVAIAANGKRTYGNAGAISIAAYNDPSGQPITPGTLRLEASLLGYSGTGTVGGALKIQTGSIQIGTAAAGSSAPGETLHLAADFFSQGGFTQFTLSGVNDLQVAPNTVIAPLAENFLLVPTLGDPTHSELIPAVLPQAQRTGVSLTLQAPTVALGLNSIISTDPGAAVTVSGKFVSVEGSIFAPAGKISIQGATNSKEAKPPTIDPDLPNRQALPTVYIGSHSILSAAGTTVLTSDPRGFHTGSVLPGGSISISGNIVAAGGSVLDVSGATAVLDVRPAFSDPSSVGPGASSSVLRGSLAGYVLTPTRVDSNAGSITLTGGAELYTDAKLVGAAGGPSALGGSLSISSGLFVVNPELAQGTLLANSTLVVQQSGLTIPAAFTAVGPAAIGTLVSAALGDNALDLAKAERGHLAVSSFSGGGFDNVSLGGRVQFVGPITLSANRKLVVGGGTDGTIQADSRVSLTAPYVALGTALQAPLPVEQPLPAATFGRGSLNVQASFVDIGDLSLRGIGRLSIVAPGGEIRGDGSLEVAGGISLLASQIYPATATTFTIAAFDKNVSVASSVQGSTAVTLSSASLPPGFGLGSSLLGSTVSKIQGATVTLAAGANATIATDTPEVFAPGSGSVIITGSGNRALPLSAGGTLDVYASQIVQGGTLRAPLGTIKLGSDSTTSSAVDPLTGQPFARTSLLTLTAGSTTSVSAVDPTTGHDLTIPYGVVLNGSQWIDPKGNDITTGGAPAKTVTLAGAVVRQEAGARIDLQGGGDLFATQFFSGVGGTLDLLGTSTLTWTAGTQYIAGQLVNYHGALWSARQASTNVQPTPSPYWTQIPQSFAILPDYQSAVAPFGAFAQVSNGQGAANLGTDAGYVLPSSISVGSQVTLNGGGGVPAGTYTLLPARYALLPGGFLITPQAAGSIPLGNQLKPGGASLVSGYITNAFGGVSASGAPILTSLEVAPQSVIHARADYNTFSGNDFLALGAISHNAAVPRLPKDGGQLVYRATTGLTIRGIVQAGAGDGGQGGLIDISSPVDIYIEGAGKSGPAGSLTLDSSELSSFSAGSLLIGGLRSFSATGTSVAVTSKNIVVDNAGAPLTGPDIILTASQSLTLTNGAEISSSGVLSGGAETLHLTGDGALVRVSSDPSAQTTRSGVNPADRTPTLKIGAGALLSGGSVALDSSALTTLDPTAVLHASSLSLSSGIIGVQLQTGAASVPGLVLSPETLHSIGAGSSSLSLLSYSSIEIFGSGSVGSASLGRLTLHTGQILGFDADGNAGGGDVSFLAGNIELDNLPQTTGASGGASGHAGTLTFTGKVIRLGAGQLNIGQYDAVALNASAGLLFGSDGGLTTTGVLNATVPLIAGAKGAHYGITAAEDLTLNASHSAATVRSGLGASLTLTGASVTDNTTILLPSGNVTLAANGTNPADDGLSVGGAISVAGTSQLFRDLLLYTDGGQVTLSSQQGAVELAAHGSINVSAAGSGDAGTITISSPGGQFQLAGTLAGKTGGGGAGGSFSLDAATLPGGSVASLGSVLTAGGFTQAIDIRDRTDRTVLVDGVVHTSDYHLSADGGAIEVTKDGQIDASGQTGGAITLQASGDVTVDGQATLTVAAKDFDHAGKGGSISLEAGAATAAGALGAGSVNLLAGSTLDLSVASATAGSAAAGHFAGTLHLRAPQTASGTDLSVAPLAGNIIGASAITVEGYQVYLQTDGSIDNAEAAISANGGVFAGNTGDIGVAGSIIDRLLAGTPNAGRASQVVVVPGAEIVNPNGDLTLTSNWDLAGYRFAPKGAPGILTIRAAGNLVFNSGASLSDGFEAAGSSNSALWQATLQTPTAGLPQNVQTWSYRLVSGADLGAAEATRVLPVGATGGEGSILLGAGTPELPTDASDTRSGVIPAYFQTIRTGTGDIHLSARGNIEILNPLATIYTAGTGLQGTDLTLGGTFTPPNLTYASSPGTVGLAQGPFYKAQYSLGGGNLRLTAQRDIGHFANESLTDASSLQMPNNWLYRSGNVDPTTGLFKAVLPSTAPASTSWWVDFSNFFEGVGALGGGNVRVSAGRNVSNLDAVAPTNARMPGVDASGAAVAPDASKLVELGGGDLTVQAGNNLNAGVYYVEHGRGVLKAGGAILTNATRTTLNPGLIQARGNAPTEWLPTTLFLGKGSFEVKAGGDLLLGPVANPFLLPQGLNNSFYQKTYFTTYGAADAVTVSSLAGTVTLRDATLSGDGALASWFENVLALNANGVTPNASSAQPWLRLAEVLSLGDPFTTVYGLMPPALQVTSFSGNIELVGNLLLAPSPRGTIDLAAAGNLDAFSVNAIIAGTPSYSSSRITLSDADPARLPGVASPLGVLTAFKRFNPVPTTSPTLFDQVDALFAESGATRGPTLTLDTQQALHRPGLLHSADATPIHLYTLTGNISGLTLFSGKAARVEAGQDLTDVALYIQNDNAQDISVISAGRDIVAYDPNSSLRQMAGPLAFAAPLAGDLQISGPGALEVLAGRDVTLGNSTNATFQPTDGTAAGLISIGNARNPSLPFAGADIVTAAGLDPSSSGLAAGALDWRPFISNFVKSSAGDRYLSELSDQSITIPGVSGQLTAGKLSSLPAAVQDTVALNVFFLALRDSGRDHNDPTSAHFGSYQGGFDAVTALFPKAGKGDLDLTSREIKTTSGGNISLLVPGGQLIVGVNAAGQQALDQGILTEDGGNISIFANGSVKVGTSRIFTLRGGNEIIFSATGDIAAGASSKTVQSAPPTRVLVDPQSGDVQTDLAGLATGGGIGVLATVTGVAPGNVDLIAPKGAVDAGDAGIQATGNLNIAAVVVLNASNIQAGGASSGVPATAAPAAPVAAVAPPPPPVTPNGPADQTGPGHSAGSSQDDAPSIITVDVISYGAGDESVPSSN